jgi:hypothetical protein
MLEQILLEFKGNSNNDNAKRPTQAKSFHNKKRK